MTGVSSLRFGQNVAGYWPMCMHLDSARQAGGCRTEAPNSAEYNFSTPPSVVNAIDYLVHERAYKPVGFVSYGGASGALRGAQMTKLLLTSLKMMPLPEAVALPFFNKLIDETTGKLVPPDTQVKAAHVMLDELLWWTRALSTLRQPSAPGRP